MKCKTEVCSDGVRRTLIGIKCTNTNCGKLFWSRKGKNIRKFCSVECSYSPKVELICGQCGKVFLRTKGRSRTNRRKHGIQFCSRKCKDYAQSLYGNCPQIRPFHYGTTVNTRIWMKKQTDYFCVGGSEKNRYLLVVHHIDGDSSNCDKSNYEIVCWNCHAKRHLKLDSGEWVYDPHSLTPRCMIGRL